MRPAERPTHVSAAQRTYARLAGFSYLGAITLAIAAGALLSRIAGSGSFAETAARMAASERLYRAALSMSVAVTLSSVLLAFALYATLTPVNQSLAQLGMIFSLCDSVLACVVRVCGFVRLHLSITSLSAPAAAEGSIGAEPLSDLVRTVGVITENIGGICFGIGSCLFFYLFFKSRYIPTILSGLGVVASGIWTGLYFAALVFPEHHAWFQYLCFRRCSWRRSGPACTWSSTRWAPGEKRNRLQPPLQ